MNVYSASRDNTCVSRGETVIPRNSCVSYNVSTSAPTSMLSLFPLLPFSPTNVNRFFPFSFSICHRTLRTRNDCETGEIVDPISSRQYYLALARSFEAAGIRTRASWPARLMAGSIPRNNEISSLSTGVTVVPVNSTDGPF